MIDPVPAARRFPWGPVAEIHERPKPGWVAFERAAIRYVTTNLGIAPTKAQRILTNPPTDRRIVPQGQRAFWGLLAE